MPPFPGRRLRAAAVRLRRAPAGTLRLWRAQGGRAVPGAEAQSGPQGTASKTAQGHCGQRWIWGRSVGFRSLAAAGSSHRSRDLGIEGECIRRAGSRRLGSDSKALNEVQCPMPPLLCAPSPWGTPQHRPRWDARKRLGAKVGACRGSQRLFINHLRVFPSMCSSLPHPTSAVGILENTSSLYPSHG